MSYSSSPSTNPLHQDRLTCLGDFYDEEPGFFPGSSSEGAKTFHRALDNAVENGRPQHSYQQNRMPHSLSECSLDVGYYRSKPPAPPTNHIILASDEIPIRLSEETAVSLGLPSVMKMPSRSELDDIKEVDLSPRECLSSPRKRSRSPAKKLFGDGVLLGKSTSMKELPSEECSRKTGLKQWGGKAQRACGAADMPRIDMSGLTSCLQSPSKSKAKSSPKTRFLVSLSPPVQAKLYSEMELMIVATANRYLQIQQREGRMSIESLSRVLETWASKNRPQVIEFLFDQATQRDLILYNLKTFRFYGPNAARIMSIHSMMQNWKSLAREMSIRNFCAPDAVVKKNLLDAFKVLEMLGAPVVTIVAFSGIKEQAERTIERTTRANNDHEIVKFGIERCWKPPAGIMEWKGYNPFA